MCGLEITVALAQVSERNEGFISQELVAVPWGIMIGKHGGNEAAAIESLENGDVIRVRN